MQTILGHPAGHSLGAPNSVSVIRCMIMINDVGSLPHRLHDLVAHGVQSLACNAPAFVKYTCVCTRICIVTHAWRVNTPSTKIHTSSSCFYKIDVLDTILP
jgi:hypothetical protein